MPSQAAAHWLHFVARGRVGLAQALGTTLNQLVVWQPAQGRRPRTRHADSIRAFDEMFIASRRNALPAMYLRATVGPALQPVVPESVVDRVPASLAGDLVAAGYPRLPNGDVEVIHLESVSECHLVLENRYSGRETIRELLLGDYLRTPFAQPLPVTPGLERVAGLLLQRGIVPPRHREGQPESPSTRDTPSPIALPRPHGPRCFDAYAVVTTRQQSVEVRRNTAWLAAGEWGVTGFDESESLGPVPRGVVFDAVASLLDRWLQQGKRALLAIDEPLGFPSGFCAAARLGDPPSWSAAHDFIAAHVDYPGRGAGDVTELAAECNRRIFAGGSGPFWGASAPDAQAVLPGRRVGVFTFPYRGVAEWRATDLRLPKYCIPQPIWRIGRGAEIGPTALFVLKHLRELRTLFGHRIQVWPTETGWTIPRTASIVVAEVFPGLCVARAWVRAYYLNRGQTLARGCLRHIGQLDAASRLGEFFGPQEGLDEAQRPAVRSEEGWILFSG